MVEFSGFLWGGIDLFCRWEFGVLSKWLLGLGGDMEFLGFLCIIVWKGEGVCLGWGCWSEGLFVVLGLEGEGIE